MVKSKLPDAVIPEIPLHQLIFVNLNQHADKISFVSIKDKVICNSFNAYTRADKADKIYTCKYHRYANSHFCTSKMLQKSLIEN